MKNIVSKLALAGAFYCLASANALANFNCGGGGGEPPCDLPEPSTAYLFLGVAGVAALVAKFRKK